MPSAKKYVFGLNGLKLHGQVSPSAAAMVSVVCDPPFPAPSGVEEQAAMAIPTTASTVAAIRVRLMRAPLAPTDIRGQPWGHPPTRHEKISYMTHHRLGRTHHTLLHIEDLASYGRMWADGNDRQGARPLEQRKARGG